MRADEAKPRPIRERIRDAEASFTPAERRIARVLTAGYPTAGLATVAELARQAEASGATIIRFMTKIGFAGYPGFQETLRGELAETLESPLARYQAGQGSEHGRYAAWASLLMRQAAEMIPDAELEAVVELLEDEKRPVTLVGGRFSRSIAALFSYGLGGLRGRVALLPGEPQEMVRALLDMSRRDIVVAFDFRRYQEEIVRFAEGAAAAGATLVVVTDKWRSPAASRARHVFALPVASPSVYDSALAPVMCVEAIVARLAERMGSRAAERIAEADRLYGRLR
jgi:DNA-binding MurR/RpiR family transcriptional regulator